MKNNVKIFCCLLLMAANASAEDYLVRQAGIAVENIDIDAVVNNIPEKTRHGVIDNPVRIQQYIQNVMMHRMVSQQAQVSGIGEDPLVQREIQHAIERIMTKHFIDNHLKNIKRPDFNTLANEQYQINKDQYVQAERVNISHILITLEERDEEQAIKIINELRSRLVAGDDFETLAVENSEDPTVKENKGRLRFVTRGNMVPEFEKAAFELSDQKPLSEPVKTQFGYHLIKFHAREAERVLDFEDVKPSMVAEMEKVFIAKAREDFVAELTSNVAEVEFNQEAIEALRTRYADGSIPGYED